VFYKFIFENTKIESDNAVSTTPIVQMLRKRMWDTPITLEGMEIVMALGGFH